MNMHSSGPAGRAVQELGYWGCAEDGTNLVWCFKKAIASPTSANMILLEAAVSKIGASMRAARQRPERALIALKRILQGQGGPAWAPSLEGCFRDVPLRPESLVYRQLLAWWLAAFYAHTAVNRPVTSPAFAKTYITSAVLPEVRQPLAAHEP